MTSKNFKPCPGQHEAQQRRGCRSAPAVRLPNKDCPAGEGTREEEKGNHKIKYYYCFANINWLLGWCWCWCWAGAGAGLGWCWAVLVLVPCWCSCWAVLVLVLCWCSCRAVLVLGRAVPKQQKTSQKTASSVVLRGSVILITTEMTPLSSGDVHN